MTTNPAPYVLGIDTGLTHCGVATIELADGACKATTNVVATIRRGDTLADRHRRIATIATGATQLAGRPLLALIEAPALDAEHGNAWDRAAVWWAVVGTLLDRDVPVAAIAPTTLKKWVTGHGGSRQKPVEKPHIVAAMRQMWPGLTCTQSDARHHECEALAMAHACAQHLGWPVPVCAHHGASLAVIKWPEVTHP